MIEVAIVTVIDRPVPEVFRFATALDEMPKWNGDLIEATQVGEAPFGVGTRLRMRVRFLGRNEADAEIVAYEPDRLVQLQVSMGKLKLEAFNIFEPAGPSTRLTRRLIVDPPGLLKLLQPLARSVVRRRHTRYGQVLKRMVEAQ